MKIDKAIELIKDKKQKEILVQFKNNFNKSDDIRLTEYADYYELIVSHPSYTDPSSDKYSGGAEQYLLNKKSGKSEMGWHEHPMKIPELINKPIKK